jgi:hypothetical protein
MKEEPSDIEAFLNLLGELKKYPQYSTISRWAKEGEKAIVDVFKRTLNKEGQDV